LYHYAASILGIRPGSPGFKTIDINPQLGPLTYAEATIPHPKGSIHVAFRMTDKGIEGEVDLPDNTEGIVGYDKVTKELRPGNNIVTFRSATKT
jgi:hypothetical protein